MGGYYVLEDVGDRPVVGTKSVVQPSGIIVGAPKQGDPAQPSGIIVEAPKQGAASTNVRQADPITTPGASPSPGSWTGMLPGLFGSKTGSTDPLPTPGASPSPGSWTGMLPGLFGSKTGSTGGSKLPTSKLLRGGLLSKGALKAPVRNNAFPAASFPIGFPMFGSKIGSKTGDFTKAGDDTQDTQDPVGPSGFTPGHPGPGEELIEITPDTTKTDATAPSRMKWILYGVGGLAVLGGIVWFVRRRRA